MKYNWAGYSSGTYKIIVSVTSEDTTITTSYFYYVIVEPDPSCFNEGTKILTDKGYILIEKLKVGDMIKTLKNGFLPIHLIGKSNLYNLSYKQRIKDQLYVYSQPELLENLILTGGHSILVDDYKNENEKNLNNNLFGGETLLIDNKIRLHVCADENASVYEKKGNHTVYNLSLENKDIHGSYGIYANGLLVEACSIYHLKEISKMELIQ